jgi:histidyl-tRNA synthetase
VAIVIGPDDRARGEVMLKDLRANTQSGTPRERVVDQVAALIRGANG